MRNSLEKKGHYKQIHKEKRRRKKLYIHIYIEKRPVETSKSLLILLTSLENISLNRIKGTIGSQCRRKK